MSDPTKPTATHRRPIVATIACLATVLYHLALLSLLLIPGNWEDMMRQHDMSLIWLMVVYSLVLTGAVGYWKMKRWGVLPYLLAVPILVIDARHHHYSVFHSLTWWVIGMIGVGLAYFRRMG